MKQSAGILLYRYQDDVLEYFLVHPGGPFFSKKNEGWWTIPKGEFTSPELPLDAALREFEEETGYLPSGPATALSPIVQKGGKQVQCWAMQGDLDPEKIVSNTFELEWPPRSGKKRIYPEIDQGGWFAKAEAVQLINERQASFLEELEALLHRT